MIVGMLRIKNEARWIDEVLKSIKPICDRIYVLDDHSTDATPEICRENGAVVIESPFTGLDEARDKDYLLDLIAKANPAGTWVLCIDGDEVLEPSGPEKIRRLIEAPDAHGYEFRIRYLWNSRSLVRIDGVYGRFSRPSMFRLLRGMTFKKTGNGGNFHCSNVPTQIIGKTRRASVDLLHLGYMNPEDRKAKYRWYNQKDPGNKAEDFYRHMVIGDLFPIDSRFAYGGPLRLEAIQ